MIETSHLKFVKASSILYIRTMACFIGDLTISSILSRPEPIPPKILLAIFFCSRLVSESPSRKIPRRLCRFIGDSKTLTWQYQKTLCCWKYADVANASEGSSQLWTISSLHNTAPTLYQGWTTSVWTGPGPGPTDRSDQDWDRTGPISGPVWSRSHLNDSDVGLVLEFPKTIGSVSVSVQEARTDQSDRDWTDVL